MANAEIIQHNDGRVELREEALREIENSPLYNDDLAPVPLHRLEADGLLSSTQHVVDGRTRRVYRATAAGRRALAEDRHALAELAREVLGWDG